MKAVKAIISTTRLFLLFGCALVALLWVFLLTPQGNSIANKYLELKIAEATGWTVKIGKFRALPPFWVSLHDIRIIPTQSSQSLESLSKEDYRKLARKEGLISASSLDIVPLLIDLPFKNISFLYLDASQVSLTLPQAKPDDELDTDSKPEPESAVSPLKEGETKRPLSPNPLTLESTKPLSLGPVTPHQISSPTLFDPHSLLEKAAPGSEKSFTLDEVLFLQKFYSSLPCAFNVIFSRLTLEKVVQFTAPTPKHPISEERLIAPSLEMKASFISMNPYSEKIEGAFSIYPRAKEIQSLFNSAYFDFKLLGASNSDLNPLHLQWNVVVDMNPLTPPKDVIESSRLRRTITARGDLKMTDNSTFEGSWNVLVPKTFDYLASHHYISSSAHAFGTISISSNRMAKIHVNDAEIKGDVFVYDPKELTEEDHDERHDGISYELNLLSIAHASPWKFSASLGQGTFTLTHEKDYNGFLKETSPSSSSEPETIVKRERIQAQRNRRAIQLQRSLSQALDGWRLEHSFPNITISSTFFNKQNKARLKAYLDGKTYNKQNDPALKSAQSINESSTIIPLPSYDERHFTWDGFFQRISSIETIHSQKKKKSLVELTISSVLKEKTSDKQQVLKGNKEWVPSTSSIVGKVTSVGEKETGFIEFSSPFIRTKGVFIPSETSTRCDLSVELPSLNDFQFLRPSHRLEGAFSCLLSFSPSIHLSEADARVKKQEMRDFIPHTSQKWHLDAALVSGSQFVYGDDVHIDNFALSLSEDLASDTYIASYILKRALLSKDHWIELSKAALKYDIKSGKISLHNALIKGTQWNTPYTLTSHGHFERKPSRHGLGSLFSGILHTNGNYGSDTLRSEMSLTLPTAIDGELTGLGTISISGSLGTKGLFHLNVISRDWACRNATAQGAITNIPSSIVTAMFDIPHANGSVSGSLYAATKNGVMKSMYKAKGSFLWLERMMDKDALVVDLTGGIDEAHSYNTISFTSPASKNRPLTFTLSTPVVQKTGHFPFFRIPTNKPIYGFIQGQCDLQSLIAPWMEEEEWAEGTLQVRSTIRGTLESQAISGEVSLTEGKLDILALGGVLSDITIHGTLYGKDIYVDDLRASDEKKGRLQGTGVLLLPIPDKRPFSWQSKLNCSNVELVNLDYATAVVSGEVTLEGSSSHLAIDGKAVSELAVIDVSKRFTLPVPEINFVYARPGTEEGEPELVYEEGLKTAASDSGFRFDLNISLQTKSPLEIKGRGLATKWNGQASLSGTPMKPSLHGSFSTTAGTFTFAGKDFDITQGNVTFGGDIIKESRLSVTARADLPHVSARVLLRGTLDKPRVSVESNPMKPEKEILSLILFNKELCDISPLESLQLASTAMTLDQSAAPLQFLDTVKKRIGIDTINIGASKDSMDNEIHVRVGKYISRGVTVNVSKGVSTEANRIGVELELAKNISAEAEIGDDSKGIVSIKWKKDF